MKNDKTTKSKSVRSESVLFLALVGLCLVAANVATNFVDPLRVDLTRGGVYSLSRGSINTVRALDDTMTVRVYFTDNLPQEFANTERQVRDLLSEYRASSRGKVVIRYIRPDNEERVEQAERDGVQKVQHQVIRDDARQQVDGYRGLAIEYRGETKALPVIASSSGLEYAITRLMRELIGTKRKIGILSGHGNTATSGGITNLKTFLPNYEFVDVDASQPIAEDVRALLVIGPESALSDDELHNIDRFVMGGGSLGVFGGVVKLPPGEPPTTLEVVDSRLNTLLDPWGIHMESAVIADARCIQRPQRDPSGQMYIELVPPVPIAPFTEEGRAHPAAYELNQAILGFTAPLTRRNAPSGARVTVLANSSEQSWKLTGSPIAVQPAGGRWTPTEPLGPFPLIAAIEGRLPSAFAASASSDGSAGPAQARTSVRVLVVGTQSPVHETFVPAAEMIMQPGNERLFELVAFSLNAIDWLANDSDLIAVRSKSIDAPMLEILQNIQSTVADAERTLNPNDRGAVERVRARVEAKQQEFERKKTLYKWGVSLGLPLLVIVFGIIRWQLRVRYRASLAR